MNPELQPTLDQLNSLQTVIGSGNAARGFHEEGDYLRGRSPNHPEGDPAYLRNYYLTKLMLITTEVAEAAEELRNGRAVDERYYSRHDATPTPNAIDADGSKNKPEGVPSEIADIVIRCFDFADEAGFSLGEAILEKLAFNSKRQKMHGKMV